MQSNNKKFIFVCTGSDCKKNGCKKVLKSLNEELKRQKKRSSVRIIKTKCMDYCKKGPNVISNNRLFHKVDPESVEHLLQ